MSAYDWASLLTGRQNPYDELRDYEKRAAAQNAAALSPDAAQGGGPPAAAPAGPPMGAPPGQPPGQPGGPAAPAPGGGATPITTPDTTPPGQPQSYSTPKDLGSIIVDLQQYNQNRADFDKSLGGFASVFAQPINRDRVMQSFQDSPAPDAGKFGQSLLELNIGQQNQDRLNALGQTINGPQGAALATKLGMTQQQLQTEYLANPQGISKLIEEQGAITPEQKNLAAAQSAIRTQVKAEHPDWTDAQIAAEVNRQAPPSMLLSGVGTLDDQAYRRYAADEQAAGRTPLDPVAWKAHTLDITKEKDAAVQEYPTIDQKLTTTKGFVDDLLSNPKAALEALQTWRPTEGKFVQYIGPDAKVEHAALILRQLKASLAAENLTGVRNVRNLTEFNTLANSVTAALDAGQDEAGLRTALGAIKDKLTTTRSIARQQAGMSAETAPAAAAAASSDGGGGGSTDFSKMDAAAADKAYEALPSGTVFVDTDGKRKKKP